MIKNSDNAKKSVFNAAKWSSITEIAAKLASPLVFMILARIIAPEAFGVIAIITMVITFVEMFTDAGFQKYLVQREFKDKKEKYQNANVAFVTNFLLSILLWGIIAIFSKNIAGLLGNANLYFVLIIACVQLPLTSFSSIQIALFRRDFDFKTLFTVRIISAFIPFIVTVPLAFAGFSYWSLIIGTIIVHIFNAILLTIKSDWKPRLFFSVRILKQMLSFSTWSLIEAISIWLTIWIDSFIVGYFLTDYHLGIFKTSTTLVNTLMALFTASTVPVLFSALSRLQNDEQNFIRVFFKMQRLVSVIVLPIGVGVFLYSDLITKILLGPEWHEASGVIAWWGLSSALMIVFGHFASEVYRAKGKPKLSFFAQTLHLVILIPVCIISASYGFWALVIMRSLIRGQFILVHLVIMKKVMGISILRTFKNVLIPLSSVVVMGLSGFLLKQFSESNLWSFFSIVTCALIYLIMIMTFKKLRVEILSIIFRIIPKRFLLVSNSLRKLI
ncbi:lipopolysaccharide biosynthesis protein [Planococcus maritimus]|uniref:lipopolysaccharide biosynthesis protein n=1 Tax=Planococcus maritimus TaxID=192421 RepID=UPI0031394B54